MYQTPRARPEGTPPAHACSSRSIVAELDARGEIDRHAAMCMDYTIDLALAEGAGAIVVDLRDLSSIDAAGLAFFARARARCMAGGARLRLLLSGRPSHVAIARALGREGFGAQLEFTCQPPAGLPVTPRLVSVS